MGAHLRANLWLLALTLVICCVLYPLLLWVIGQAAFPSAANGSLVEQDDKTVGSRLIGQSFSGDGYFQPRPSAAGDGYDASASGASNYAASNPKLRGRVAQALGTLARYKTEGPRHGAYVGDDVEKWYHDEMELGADGKPKRDLVAEWATANPTLAQVWATSSTPVKEFVPQWAKDHPEVMSAWKQSNPNAISEPKPDDLADEFFKSYTKAHPGAWPGTVEVEEEKDGKKEKKKVVQPITKGDEIKQIFFETWLTEQWRQKKLDPLKDLEQVPADLVMASGSGLDPHISQRGAEYQLDRVVKEREGQVQKSGGDQAKVREVVQKLVKDRAFRPLAGLAGGDALVNVLELNMALDAAIKQLEGPGSR